MHAFLLSFLFHEIWPSSPESSKESICSQTFKTIVYGKKQSIVIFTSLWSIEEEVTQTERRGEHVAQSCCVQVIVAEKYFPILRVAEVPFLCPLSQVFMFQLWAPGGPRAPPSTAYPTEWQWSAPLPLPLVLSEVLLSKKCTTVLSLVASSAKHTYGQQRMNEQVRLRKQSSSWSLSLPELSRGYVATFLMEALTFQLLKLKKFPPSQELSSGWFSTPVWVLHDNGTLLFLSSFSLVR